jgi:hypothetical protein
MGLNLCRKKVMNFIKRFTPQPMVVDRVHFSIKNGDIKIARKNSKNTQAATV